MSNHLDPKEIFKLQFENRKNIANTDSKARKAKLKALLKAIQTDFKDKIRKALFEDFKKSPQEVDLSELYPVIGEIKHALKDLDKWMAKKPVDTPIGLLGSSSYIKSEAKGVCLIISPWNFPINLSFGPLVSAISAGNTAIIKPSELTPNTSSVISEIITSLFEKNEIAVIEGGIETSTELLTLPFHHIFFTGAPSIGKIVMQAAAKNLCSVTLELGGKSPTIVDKSANLGAAAKRLVWGKFLNAGQICIAPDYVYVENEVKEAFLDKLKKEIETMFSNDPQKSSDYSNIVNQKHTLRIAGYLEDAKQKGANIIHGGKVDVQGNYISPTLVDNLDWNNELMQNEIFGPVLPIFGFDDINEVVEVINRGEKPLAMYIYSKKQKNIDQLISNTSAGTTCINNNDVQFFNTYLPFGGVNNSGIGKSHGHYGYQAFSNQRAVMIQHIPSAIELMMPPYSNFKDKLIALSLKYF
jgi:aldehyde dehydrogenase (NAD+)